MGRKEGPLRIAINDWLNTNPITKWIKDYVKRVVDRRNEWNDLWDAAVKEMGIIDTFQGAFNVLLAFGWIFAGIDWCKGSLNYYAKGKPDVQWKKKIETFWKNAFDDTEIADIIDGVGTFTSEPILQLFEKFTPEDVQDPRAFIRRFHGTMLGMSLAPGMLSTLMEALSLGQVDTPAEVMKSIYWNFGFGFMGWQTIAPLMTAGMLRHLERYYNEKFRPQNFSASELRDLFALGEINEDRFKKEAAQLGWSDDDYLLWRRLAFRNLSEGDIHAALKTKLITEEQWMVRLRALGFDPSDFKLLYDLNITEDVDEAKTVTLSTAKAALREGLMGEAEFRTILSELGKNEREIELLLNLQREQAEQDLKRLTVAQIRSAWEENVLGDNEASHWLAENHFGPTEIALLMRTWSAEIEPVFRRLNKGTVVGAYIAAVLNRAQAALKLQEIGFAPDDARLELDLAEARSPELFGLPVPAPLRHLTPGILGQLLEADLISPAVMYEKLLAQMFSDEDAALMVQAAMIRASEEPRPVSQLLIERAYIAGVLARSDAYARLIAIEFLEEDANLILDTVESEYPAVFAPETVQAVRIPTVGALVEALRLSIIETGEFYARMFELGYNRESADMYLALATTGERKSVKTLTKAEISNMYERDFFDRSTSMIRMMQLGYNDQDASLILRLVKSGIEDTDTWKNMLKGILTVSQAVEQLFSMGFTMDEVTEAFNKIAEEEESA